MLSKKRGILHLLNGVRSLSTNIKNKAEELMNSKQVPQDKEATLYIHWPYCQKRCHYCNFNKYISQNVDHEKMKKCLVRETKTLLSMSGVERVKSIFFGGGTPSLAEPATISAIVDCVSDAVAMAPDAEVSMEANPTSAEWFRLSEFKTAGINRLSLGVQSFKDSCLKLLGRNHSSLDALRALEAAKTLFPGKVSLDLIFGIPNQKLTDWKEELEGVLKVCDNHISLYQLTLERGTNLFKWHQAGDVSLPDADETADMYQIAVDRMAEAGFRRYEVSNFARDDSVSIHNLSYWTGGQYIGIGPGAHGRFSLPWGNPESFDGRREARVQTPEPNSWMCEVEKFGHATCKRVKLSQLDSLKELIMTGLRTNRGIANRTWMQLSGGKSLIDIFGNCQMLNSLGERGLLELTCNSF
ncbi:radical S-adenosyl methionine domain-containing protein 1, mitochondrial-like [Apostichopus japonicus]|uniref:radical S-adenosyl methionine domain-containing protein 1, mitochondrial-like n=1 Tax=Stichopus japonicus TaxID=307972 RepID=UPI003AB7F826